MDNLIPPLSSPSINISGTENGINGNIVNFPSEVQIAVRPGQSYLLEILMTEGMGLGAENEIKAQIDIAGQKIPLDIKLDSPLKLSPASGSMMQVKIGNIDEKGQMNIKLFPANNEKTLPIKTQELSALNESLPLVVDVDSKASQSAFHPLKIEQILRNLSAKLHLPAKVENLLSENFQNAEISVDWRTDINKTNVQNAVLAESNTTKNAMERIELILKNFTSQILQKKPSSSDIEHFIFQIKNELLPLKNTFLTGTAFSNPDSKLLALRTPLGNFLPDKLIKLENLSNVLLEINSVRFSDPQALENLEGLKASRELTQNLPSILGVLKDLLNTSIDSQTQTDKVLDIFKTLHNLGKDDLAHKIMQKFPSLEGKIVENMFHFIKAANQHNSEIWLGKEIFQDLRNLGPDGQEISMRLNDFMSASVREGQNWKIINLPIINGEQISRIRLALKNIQEEEAQRTTGRHKKSARFVVDTNFSRLGAFQFDGFSFVKDRQFDLIIRTQKAVDEDLKSNIFRIFKTTLHNLHYSGTIKINVKENFIKICENEEKEETIKQGLYV